MKASTRGRCVFIGFIGSVGFLTFNAPGWLAVLVAIVYAPLFCWLGRMTVDHEYVEHELSRGAC